MKPLLKSVMPLVAAALIAPAATAQSNDAAQTLREIERYRQMLLEGNPADLVAAAGEELWKTKRGPKNASLEQCDLGLGPGVVEGAYAQMPRYFADTDQVMDFETRVVHCMVTLQGLNREEVIKRPFSGAGQQHTDIEKLVAYAADASRDMPISLPQDHPKEKASYARGEKIFFYRAGPYDFACATCHAIDGQRIRLQDLPNLTQAEPAKAAFATWPAYRVSLGALRTMQWRMADCFRQQRFPSLEYGSQASIDLITYIGVKAKGGTYDGPGIKR